MRVKSTQIDPLVAYKNEGYTMFEELMHSIWEEFSKLIFHVEVDIAPAEAEYAEEVFEAPPPVQQRVLSEEETVGRNDPCWCGSGKKFKKCHGS